MYIFLNMQYSRDMSQLDFSGHFTGKMNPLGAEISLSWEIPQFL